MHGVKLLGRKATTQQFIGRKAVEQVRVGKKSIPIRRRRIGVF